VFQRLPERAEIDGSLDEQLIVEYYSRLMCFGSLNIVVAYAIF
jgi:hypothetical protein